MGPNVLLALHTSKIVLSTENALVDHAHFLGAYTYAGHLHEMRHAGDTCMW